MDDLVYAENFSNPPPKWIPGKITKVTGPLSYQVELESGLVVHRRVNSLQSRKPTATTTESSVVHLPDSGEVDPLILPDLQTVQPAATPPTSAPSMVQPAPPTQFTFSATPTTAAPHKMHWKLCDRKKHPNYSYK